MSLIDTLKKTKIASRASLNVSNDDRNKALNKIADAIIKNKNLILIENQKDLVEARQAGLKSSLLDRLELSNDRIMALSEAATTIAKQEDVVGQVLNERLNSQGLKISQQRVPLGVLAMIFESRPNVVVDCSCLAIKSGNAIVLKGGKEAKHSNRVLFNIIEEAIAGILPSHSICLIEDRSEVAELLKQRDLVDLVIPRGGEKLIDYVYKESKIPVIAHFKGNCHVYIHSDANPEQAKAIVLNAKMQRPGVCNAMETLLVNKDFPKAELQNILKELNDQNCELRVSKSLVELAPSEAKLASDEDYATEFLEQILAVKEVENIQEACLHISIYGSKHTEAILSTNDKALAEFSRKVDASCIMQNASTRFNDGGELGLGAELGISTTKFHAYGPMGAKEMTCLRFLVKGEGNIR